MELVIHAAIVYQDAILAKLSAGFGSSCGAQKGAHSDFYKLTKVDAESKKIDPLRAMPPILSDGSLCLKGR